MTSRLKILLIDDDPAVRASLTFSLELEGFQVETFDCAEDLARKPDLPLIGSLVVDYRLPGMDGLTLLHVLRMRGVCLPAVLITTSPNRTTRSRAAQLGAKIVEKPLMCDELASAIRAGLAVDAKAA